MSHVTDHADATRDVIKGYAVLPASSKHVKPIDAKQADLEI